MANELSLSIKKAYIWYYKGQIAHTLSTYNTENIAMILDVLNGVNWPRKLTQNDW